MPLIEIAKSGVLKVNAKKDDVYELIVYGAIGSGWWGDSISAKQFSDKISEIPDNASEIIVRMNSEGGDVFEGVTIYNRLKGHKAKKKTVMVEGLAASIASIIMLAGDEVIIGEGAMVMVHLPWTGRWGNRMDFENTIQNLMNIEERMIDIYSKATGLDREAVRQLMEAETWMGSDVAIEKGFVDKKMEEDAAAASIAASSLDRQWLNKVPRNIKTTKEFVSAKVSDLQKSVQEVLNKK